MPRREPRLWSNEAGASWTRVGRLVDANATAQTVMAQLTGGVFLTSFALALGAGPLAIGALAAIPLIAKFSQLLLSAAIESAGFWKPVTVMTAAAARAILFVIPVFAVLPGPNAIRLAGVVAALALSSLAASVYELAFLTWMAELIPEPLRGVFWGRRGRTAGLVGIAASIAAASLLPTASTATPSLARLASVFGAGAAIGVVGIGFLRVIPDARRRSRRDAVVSARQVLAAPLRDPNFVRFLRFSALWSITSGAMAPFYMVYMLRVLHLSVLAVTLLTALTNGLMALTQTHWGRLGDHFGTKPVLRIGAYLIALTPLCWLATPRMPIWPVILVQVLSGLGWSAFHVSQSNLALKLAPIERRPSYLGAFGAVVGLAEGLAPMALGAGLALFITDPVPSVGVLHAMMLVQLAMFAIATILPARILEPGGVAVGHLIRVMARYRTMDAARPVALLFEHGYTHLARVADLIAREFPRDAEPL
jgi:MFS family permease